MSCQPNGVSVSGLGGGLRRIRIRGLLAHLDRLNAAAIHLGHGHRVAVVRGVGIADFAHLAGMGQEVAGHRLVRAIGQFDAGQVVEEASVEDIFHATAHPYTEGLLRSVTSLGGEEKELYTIMAEIKQEVEPDTLDVHHHIAVVAAVGRRMAFRPGISGKIFAALGEAGINIRMINQGPDELNIIFGVDNKDFQEAIRVLYNSFVK